MDEWQLNIGLMQRIRSKYEAAGRTLGTELAEDGASGSPQDLEEHHEEDVIPDTPSPVFNKIKPQRVYLTKPMQNPNGRVHQSNISRELLSQKYNKDNRKDALARLKAQRDKRKNPRESSSDEEELEPKKHQSSSGSESELEETPLTNGTNLAQTLYTTHPEQELGSHSRLATTAGSMIKEDSASCDGKNTAVGVKGASIMESINANIAHVSACAEAPSIDHVQLGASGCSEGGDVGTGDTKDDVLDMKGVPGCGNHSPTKQHSDSDSMEDNMSLASFANRVRKKSPELKNPPDHDVAVSSRCGEDTKCYQGNSLHSDDAVMLSTYQSQGAQGNHASLSVSSVTNTDTSLYADMTPNQQQIDPGCSDRLSDAKTFSEPGSVHHDTVLISPTEGRHSNVTRYSAKWNKFMTAARQKCAGAEAATKKHEEDDDDDDDFKLSSSQKAAQRLSDSQRNEGSKPGCGQRRHRLAFPATMSSNASRYEAVSKEDTDKNLSSRGSSSTLTKSLGRENMDTSLGSVTHQGSRLLKLTPGSRCVPRNGIKGQQTTNVRKAENEFKSAREEMEIRNRSRNKDSILNASSAHMKPLKKRKLPSSTSSASLPRTTSGTSSDIYQGNQTTGASHPSTAVPELQNRNPPVTATSVPPPTASTASEDLDIIALETPSEDTAPGERRRGKRRRTASTARNIWAALTPVARGMSSRRHQTTSPTPGAEDEVILLSPDPVETINLIESDEALARRLQEEMDMEYAASLAASSHQTDSLVIPPPLPPSPPPLRGTGVNLYSPVRMRGTRVRNARAPVPVATGARTRSGHIQNELDHLNEEDVAMLMRIGASWGVQRATHLEQATPELAAQSQRFAYTVDEVQGMLDQEVMQYLAARRNHRVNAVSVGRRGRGRQRAGRTWLSAYGPNDGNDYEELLDLAERLGDVKKRGLSTEEISCLPTKSYSKTDEVEQRECHICMCDYTDGENLRILTCFHEFHAPCIDRWIKDNPTCPVCRVEVQLH
ncbi:E3 ubiquitin-protein ligase Arkadia isoform X2 [Lingula anatina]|uniref:E3 ubiquitin-protein ligase Arkadia isoform X2 n=1 Tax=Lingula anatina TaxID=7574 RepID=A0A1S3JL49_LINAN|nr:E3 ubiquitin-protein ligase Arkadia isoform X2 [Lingula anatina]|eukprot:XP_013410634.1 E3 ubiquitin-protein ligase Arkadia isoform X2 [Lingula anatina]